MTCVIGILVLAGIAVGTILGLVAEAAARVALVELTSTSTALAAAPASRPPASRDRVIAGVRSKRPLTPPEPARQSPSLAPPSARLARIQLRPASRGRLRQVVEAAEGAFERVG